MADTRLVIGVVGAPERSELAEQVRALVRHLGGAEPIDRVGSGFLAYGGELLADALHRIVPGDALPLTVGQLHRIFEPAVAGHQLAHRSALGAVRATIDRRIPARLLADPHAVGDFRGDGAADRAMRADAFADRHHSAGRR